MYKNPRLVEDETGTSLEIDPLDDDDFIVLTSGEDSFVIAKAVFFEGFAIPSWWKLDAISGENLDDLITYRLTDTDQTKVVQLLGELRGEASTFSNIPLKDISLPVM